MLIAVVKFRSDYPNPGISGSLEGANSLPFWLIRFHRIDLLDVGKLFCCNKLCTNVTVNVIRLKHGRMIF